MVQYIRAERGCIELLILAQLGHIGVQQMGVIHRMQQIAALPAALLQGKAQLLGAWAGELLAEELRLAQQNLSEITGEFTSDDLLGRIFSSFCIGK